jgi:hypothetical protein
MAEDLQSCREQADGDDTFNKRACVRAAREDARACVAVCQEAQSCRGGLRPCLSECVLDEPDEVDPEA